MGPDDLTWVPRPCLSRRWLRERSSGLRCAKTPPASASFPPIAPMAFASTSRKRALVGAPKFLRLRLPTFNCVMLQRYGCVYAYGSRNVGGVTSYLTSPSLIGSCHLQCPLHRQVLHALMRIQWEEESCALAPFVNRLLNFAQGHLELQTGPKCLSQRK